MIAVITKRMIAYFGSDARRINHALKVHSFAKNIADLENIPVNLKPIIETTAILHDIGIKEAERKYNSSAGNYQEIEGPVIARNLLQDIAFTKDEIDRICFIIGNHHSLSKIDGIDFQIIVEADFIVNIFEDELSKAAKSHIYENHIKTISGKEIIKTMYLS